MGEAALIQSLRDAQAYPHDCGEIQLIETHISWVLLTGIYAYKVKKPVEFGFLDFHTLAKRHYNCTEEFRCNTAFAPEIYCGVEAIVRDEAGKIKVGGIGDIVEYAVKMRQFDHHMQLDILLDKGQLKCPMIRAFARDLAKVYSRAPRLSGEATFEIREMILEPVLENLKTLERAQASKKYHASLGELRTWSIDTYDSLSSLLAERVRDHWIRERHGDLHLSNLVLTENGVRAFDCIEFSQRLRQIDAINDIAFLFMDCAVRKRSDLAYAFVDAYLDATGDYAGSRLLRFYSVYRSLVRAKVAVLKLDQTFDPSAAERVAAHIEWAAHAADRPTGGLTLMCGISGSGKSWIAQRLASSLGAIRIRSDIVRRQLDALDVNTSLGSGIDRGLYSATNKEAVYKRLAHLSTELFASGENVIVDATLLTRSDRAAFRAIAQARNRPCNVVLCEAHPDILKQRVTQRLDAKVDPSEATPAVIDRQLEIYESPLYEEQVVYVRTDEDVDIAKISADLLR